MDISRLKRAVYPMPDDVEARLQEADLLERYKMRPPYQQNDYIGWITRAKRPETREKRLKQMLDELHSGWLYMGMKYNAK
ncbi:YdeI/OmpD-associated family protein [Neobacillus sp. Marseille-QA0830]